MTTTTQETSSDKVTCGCRVTYGEEIVGQVRQPGIVFCPLHAAAPRLLAACKKAVFRVDPERPRVIFPTNGSTMQALEEAIAAAEGGRQP